MHGKQYLQETYSIECIIGEKTKIYDQLSKLPLWQSRKRKEKKIQSTQKKRNSPGAYYTCKNNIYRGNAVQFEFLLYFKQTSLNSVPTIKNLDSIKNY